MAKAQRTREARYTDGTLVQEGDSIRYHQAPGGILPPSVHYRNGERTIWKNGTAVMSTRPILGEYELVLEDEDGRHYMIVGHVIERQPQTETQGETA